MKSLWSTYYTDIDGFALPKMPVNKCFSVLPTPIQHKARRFLGIHSMCALIFCQEQNFTRIYHCEILVFLYKIHSARQKHFTPFIWTETNRSIKPVYKLCQFCQQWDVFPSVLRAICLTQLKNAGLNATFNFQEHCMDMGGSEAL